MKAEENNLTISNHDFKVKSYWLDQVADFGQPVDYPIVVICPGGGFTFHSQREEEPVALRFNSFGMHAVVLEYKLIDKEPVYPLALQELGKVIDWINQQPASRHIDKQRIILAGFSAGGHIVAAYNGIATDEKLRKKYHLDQFSGQHAAAILGYPVIDMTVKGSFPSDDKVREEITPDKALWKTQDLLNKNSKPVFVWQTRTDELVNVINSLMYVEKMNQLDLPVEYHLFGSGIHGLVFGTYVTKKPGKDKYLNAWTAKWIELALNWLEMMKLIG
ncbi:alpha/beta hydrolase [Companilactobacillus halodurans]|uniref:Alpha/beta hydrolase n=1 Tax=Companilactobacillus halodurans TaxID=2584183 RepID=A0A5P0ZU77_9LACO|nr:alpha/beta hydrolase [Companilactobacillus halodurans]MQS76281.1 alpha/beta hydrolase [Companilactobacillus halodurans]MQS96589.1 alpha/beta hydrolase [Companilactobacillus halodurans]